MSRLPPNTVQAARALRSCPVQRVSSSPTAVLPQQTDHTVPSGWHSPDNAKLGRRHHRRSPRTSLFSTSKQVSILAATLLVNSLDRRPGLTLPSGASAQRLDFWDQLTPAQQTQYEQNCANPVNFCCYMGGPNWSPDPYILDEQGRRFPYDQDASDPKAKYWAQCLPFYGAYFERSSQLSLKFQKCAKGEQNGTYVWSDYTDDGLIPTDPQSWSPVPWIWSEDHPYWKGPVENAMTETGVIGYIDKQRRSDNRPSLDRAMLRRSNIAEHVTSLPPYALGINGLALKTKKVCNASSTTSRLVFKIPQAIHFWNAEELGGDVDDDEVHVRLSSSFSFAYPALDDYEIHRSQFFLDPRVSGTVTIRKISAVDAEEAIRAFEAMNIAELVAGADGRNKNAMREGGDTDDTGADLLQDDAGFEVPQQENRNQLVGAVFGKDSLRRSLVEHDGITRNLAAENPIDMNYHLGRRFLEAKGQGPVATVEVRNLHAGKYRVLHAIDADDVQELAESAKAMDAKFDGVLSEHVLLVTEGDMSAPDCFAHVKPTAEMAPIRYSSMSPLVAGIPPVELPTEQIRGAFTHLDKGDYLVVDVERHFLFTPTNSTSREPASGDGDDEVKNDSNRISSSFSAEDRKIPEISKGKLHLLARGYLLLASATDDSCCQVVGNSITAATIANPELREVLYSGGSICGVTEQQCNFMGGTFITNPLGL